MATDAPRSLKNPVRMLMERFQRRESAPQPPASASPATGTSVLDYYCTTAPTPQTMLDIFKGEWSSKLPTTAGELQAGGIPLFEDSRIAWGLSELGGIDGQKVLELGPLEGGHSYMLEKAGAASVTSIEANTRAFLKCLVTKELLGMQKTRFLCGDFMEFLRTTKESYDFTLASGVLYHMRQPAELIHLLAQVTDRVLIWTHYYDGEIIRNTPHLVHKFPAPGETTEVAGFRHTLYRQEYAEGLGWNGFCGGTAAHSYWMTRSDILNCLRYFGFTHLRVHMEHPDFVNGPCFLIAGRKA